MNAEYTYTCSHTLRRWVTACLYVLSGRPNKYIDWEGQPAERPDNVSLALRLCYRCKDDVVLDGWHIDLDAPCGVSVVERGSVLVLGVPMEPDSEGAD